MYLRLIKKRIDRGHYSFRIVRDIQQYHKVSNLWVKFVKKY